MNSPCCKLFLGPMYSEKTSQLMRCIRRALLADFFCIVIKYAKDTRYSLSPELITHDGITLKNKNRLKIVSVNKLSEIKLKDEEKKIAIDEGQFYPDLYDFLQKCMNEGRDVYISALDGDFRRQPFGEIPRVIPLCTHIEKMRGICMVCKTNESSYTKRIVNSNEIELIGSFESYISTCYNCFN